jgi:hypothetical protein
VDITRRVQSLAAELDIALSQEFGATTVRHEVRPDTVYFQVDIDGVSADLEIERAVLFRDPLPEANLLYAFTQAIESRKAQAAAEEWRRQAGVVGLAPLTYKSQAVMIQSFREINVQMNKLFADIVQSYIDMFRAVEAVMAKVAQRLADVKSDEDHTRKRQRKPSAPTRPSDVHPRL